jgi:acetoin utilization deacetylase AcuC-like enzyme
MKVGWIYDRRFLKHHGGIYHIECPERLEVIVETLEKTGVLARLTPLEFGFASAAQLALVHEPAYVDLVRLACEEGFTFIGTRDTRICPFSYDAAALAVGGVLAACDAVMAGRVTRAFCAVRPPGHHAEIDQAMGFCLFNNVAIAVEHLVRHHQLSRVAIVDFDVHHGNGTQHFFESRADVLYISIHENPGSLLFPGTGEASEVGSGPGIGYTVNVPLGRFSTDAHYRAAFDDQIVPALDRYRPEFLLLSAGFDALAGDNVSHVSLEPKSFGWITELMVGVAERHAGGRIVSVLEGGYDLGNLGQAVATHVAALAAGSGSKGESAN